MLSKLECDINKGQVALEKASKRFWKTSPEDKYQQFQADLNSESFNRFEEIARAHLRSFPNKL